MINQLNDTTTKLQIRYQELLTRKNALKQELDLTEAALLQLQGGIQALQSLKSQTEASENQDANASDKKVKKALNKVKAQ